MGGGKSPTLQDRLFHFGEELAYVITLSAVWSLISIPLVTIPAATSAVYGTIGTHVVDGSRQYVAPFKMAFVGSFKRVTLPGIVLLLLVGLTGFNSFYYFTTEKSSVLTAASGVLQIVLGSVGVVLLGFYLLLVGLHYARGHVGPAPTLKESASVALYHPLSALVVLIVSVGIPAAVILMHLWQFLVFVVGAVCYANVWLLFRFGLPQLAPER